MGDGSAGDRIGEIFKKQPRSSNEKKFREGLRVKNRMENTKGFFLWLVGVALKASTKLLKDRVMKRYRPHRGSNRAIGLKMGHVVKGALKPFEDVGGHSFKVIVSEPIKSAKKPGHNGDGVPACWRQGRRGRLRNRE